jgi:hypothetical protein
VQPQQQQRQQQDKVHKQGQPGAQQYHGWQEQGTSGNRPQ